MNDYKKYIKLSGESTQFSVVVFDKNLMVNEQSITLNELDQIVRALIEAREVVNKLV